MASEAGASALAMYRRVRWKRRRRVASGVVLLAAAAAGAVLSAPPAPVLVAAAAGLVALLAGWAGPSVRDPSRWRRGAYGEVRTASLLEALPPRRWSVWHDLRVPGSRSNIDHVILGRTGVWVVDSKTTRAAVRAGWRSVRFGDRRLDTGPTRWEADVLAEELDARLGDRLGRPVPVRAVVAVHGDGLRRRGGRAGGVRVVPAEQVVRHVTRGRRRLRRRERTAVREAMVESFGAEAGASLRRLRRGRARPAPAGLGGGGRAGESGADGAGGAGGARGAGGAGHGASSDGWAGG